METLEERLAPALTDIGPGVAVNGGNYVPLAASATAIVGVPFVSPVAYFTDPGANASDFGNGFLTVGQSLGGTYHAPQTGSIIINWGDGSSSVGLAFADPNNAGGFFVYPGNFSGLTGHSYLAQGTYTITTAITGDGGQIDPQTPVSVQPFSANSLQPTLNSYAAPPPQGVSRFGRPDPLDPPTDPNPSEAFGFLLQLNSQSDADACLSAFQTGGQTPLTLPSGTDRVDMIVILGNGINLSDENLSVPDGFNLLIGFGNWVGDGSSPALELDGGSGYGGSLGIVDSTFVNDGTAATTATILERGGNLILGNDTIQGAANTTGPLIDQQGGSLDLNTYGTDTLTVQANSSNPVPILEAASGGLTLSGTNIVGTLSSQTSNGGITTYNYLPSTYDVTDTLTTSNPSTGSLYVDTTPLTGSLEAVQAVAGLSFNGPVAEFTDISGNDATQYSAKINWGDGQTSGGVISYNSVANDYIVTGTHGSIYQNDGSAAINLPITVQITDNAQIVETIGGSATVACLTGGNLQSAIQAASSSNSSLMIQSPTYGDLQAVATALNQVDQVDPSLTGTIQLSLPGNDYSPTGAGFGVTLSLPSGVTLVINNGNPSNGQIYIDPTGPALTVTSGTVVVTGATFFTTGDAPTILVTGGTLVLGDDTIQQSNDLADDPPLIEVTGGTVDLTTLGGNTLTVTQGAPLNVVGAGLAAQVSSQNVLSLTDLGGAFTGNSFPATASATADGSISLNYYDIVGDQLSGAPVFPGTYTVVASFASNDPNFPNATSQATFTITQTTPTLTLTTPQATYYDGQPITAAATIAGVVPGVDNSAGGSLESVPVTVSYYTASGTLLNGAPVDAGTYTVVAVFAGSTDYAAASKSATFTISPAPLTVTVNSVSAIYGQPIPTLGGSINGIQNGDPITAAYSTLATPTSPVGSYPIAVTLSDNGSGKLADYAVTVISGTVAITQPTPGASVVGSTLYVYGAYTGHSGDSIQISPVAGGVQVSGTINGVRTNQTYNQPTSAIYVYGFNNTQTVQLAASVAIPAFIYEGNANGNQVQGGNANIVVVMGNGNGDTVQLGNGNDVVTLRNGNGDSIQLGGGTNLVTVGNGNGDRVAVGDGNNIVTAGNGNGDVITAGNGYNLLIAGLGQHSVQAGNGSNILIDGSATPQGSATLSQVLDEWILDGASAASLIRSQLSVTDNSSHPNTMSAGRGLDWFWATYAKDKIDPKSGDLRN